VRRRCGLMWNYFDLLFIDHQVAKLMAGSCCTLQQAAPFPLIIAANQGGIWTPSNTWFLVPAWILNPNGISIGSAIFAQLTAEFPYSLQWVVPSALSIGSSGLLSNTYGSLGPTQVLNPTASRFVEPFLQGSIVWQTDQQTMLLGW